MTTTTAHQPPVGNGRVLKARLTAGLPLRALTARSGVSAATLSAIERWGYLPTAKTRRRIADALEVPVDQLWPELEPAL